MVRLFFVTFYGFFTMGFDDEYSCANQDGRKRQRHDPHSGNVAIGSCRNSDTE